MQKLDLKILGCSYSDLKENMFFANYTDNVKSSEYGLELYLSNKEKGIEFIFDDERKLSSIHFFGKGHKEYSPFDGMLPFDITLSDSKPKVYEKFGKFEIKKGGGEVLPILGKSNEWSIFNFEEYSFRFEFKNDEVILITFSKANQSPQD